MPLTEFRRRTPAVAYVLPLTAAEQTPLAHGIPLAHVIWRKDKMNRKGFTLIELLIVVVIIGILAAIAIPKFASTKEKAYLASMKTDLRNLATAQEAFAADNNQNYFTATITNPGGFPAGCGAGGVQCLIVPSSGVTLTITATAATGWSATATHTGAVGKTCAIFVGVAAVAPATVEGEPKCA